MDRRTRPPSTMPTPARSAILAPISGKGRALSTLSSLTLPRRTLRPSLVTMRVARSSTGAQVRPNSTQRVSMRSIWS